MNFKVIESTPDMLEELYNDNSFTFEGLAIESLDQLIDYLKDHFKNDIEEVIIYDTLGKVMNEHYNLIGGNRYPDDLNIVSLKLDNFDDLGKLAMLKIRIGARWFNDIVDNNARMNKSAKKMFIN